jgi:hypothetical protein
VIRPGVLVTRPGVMVAMRLAPAVGGAAPADATITSASAPADAVSAPRVDRVPASSASAVLNVKGWRLDQLNQLSYALGRGVVIQGSDSVFLPDDATVIGVSLTDGLAANFAVRRRDGSAVAAASSTNQAFVFQDPVPITALDAIAILGSGEADLRTSLVLSFNVLGTIMPLDVPILLRGSNSAHQAQDVIRFGAVTATRELIDHLQANRLHYSQAVFRALDAAAIASLLSPYSYRSLPLRFSDTA